MAARTTDRRYARVPVIAREFGVSPDSVWRAINAGRLTRYSFDGRLVLVSVAEVERLLRPVPVAATGGAGDPEPAGPNGPAEG